ncbi:MAG: hypothetical protein ABI675_14370 [Chitinophagaceae bacterium]
MLNNISWASYWYALFVLSFLYYTFILFVYYRNELVQRIQSTRPVQRRKEKNQNINAAEETNYADSNDSLKPAAQSLINEIVAYLQTTGGHADKQGVIISLRHIIKKYINLSDGRYRDLINEMIQSACKDKCAIHLKDEDVKQMWMN